MSRVLSQLGRGVHLAIGKRDGNWVAVVRLNPNDDGDGVSVMGCSCSSVTHAVKRAASLARAALANPLVRDMLPPHAASAVDITERLAQLAHSGALSRPLQTAAGEVKPLWQHLENPVLRQLAKAFSSAVDGKPGAALSGPVTLVEGELGYRGARGASAFGARRPFAQRYARGRRRRGPARREHPWHHPYPPAPMQPASFYRPYTPSYPPAPYAPPPYPSAPDEAGGAASPSDPSQDPSAAPDPTQAPDPSAAPAPAATSGMYGLYGMYGYEMGWNPFRSIKNAIKGVVHGVEHVAGTIEHAAVKVIKVVGPELSVAAGALATVYGGPVAGALASKIVGGLVGAVTKSGDAKAAHQSAVQQVEQVAQSNPTVAKALDAAHAALANTVQQYLPSVVPNAAALPSSTDITQGVESAASSAVSNLAQEGVQSLVSMLGWSPSPYYGTFRPSWDIPTRRPLTFRDAYRRIFTPGPRHMTFPGAF